MSYHFVLFFPPENNEGHNDANRANIKCGSGHIEDDFVPITIFYASTEIFGYRNHFI